MFNPPPNSFQNSGSYMNILKRMTRRVQQKKVDNQILEMLQQVFENALGEENIVLSRSERKRLFQQVSKTILTDMLGAIDSTQ